jgi:hypothetical protein
MPAFPAHERLATFLVLANGTLGSSGDIIWSFGTPIQRGLLPDRKRMIVSAGPKATFHEKVFDRRRLRGAKAGVSSEFESP